MVFWVGLVVSLECFWCLFKYVFVRRCVVSRCFGVCVLFSLFGFGECFAVFFIWVFLGSLYLFRIFLGDFSCWFCCFVIFGGCGCLVHFFLVFGKVSVFLSGFSDFLVVFR